MANFINAHMNPCNLVHSAPKEWWKENGEKIRAWWGKGIRANPKRKAAPDSVKIIRGWGSREIVNETQKLFDAYGNDEVALLAFSLKGEKTPIRAIVDKMGKNTNENWAILCGNASSSDEVLTGKRLASTIHRMKGLERRGIVVCGMDSYVEKLYPNNPLDHFNVFYVACTRAKDRLIINATGVDYATIRCSPLADNSKAKQCCEVDQLVAYIPFDDTLSVTDKLFRAQVELAFDEKALTLDRTVFIVQGRTLGTVEDLSPFMSRAILFKLMLMVHGNLFRIPIDHDSPAHDRDMVDFIHQFYDRIERVPSSVDWPSLMKYSVAYETIRSKYKHIWRQLSDYEAFTPVALMEKCTSNALCLLWTLAQRKTLVDKVTVDPVEMAIGLKPFIDFEVPMAYPFYPQWFLSTYVGQISCVADIVFNRDTIVGIECNDVIQLERGLELSLYASIRHLLKTNPAPTPTNTIMILTNTAQMVSLNIIMPSKHPDVPVEYELLHRCARRKMQLKASEGHELLQDFRGRNTNAPRWLKLAD
jgi:hypothetical protein